MHVSPRPDDLPASYPADPFLQALSSLHGWRGKHGDELTWDDGHMWAVSLHVGGEWMCLYEGMYVGMWVWP